MIAAMFATRPSSGALKGMKISEGMPALDASPPSITPPESPAEKDTLWSCQWPSRQSVQAERDGWEAIDTERSAGDDCQFAFDEEDEDAWVDIDNDGEPTSGRSQVKTDLGGFVSVCTVKVGGASAVVQTESGAAPLVVPARAPPTASAAPATEAVQPPDSEQQPSEEQQSYMAAAAAAAAEQLMQVSAMITEQFQVQLEQQRSEMEEKLFWAEKQRNHQKKLRKAAQKDLLSRSAWLEEAQAEKEALRVEMLKEKEQLEKRLREEMRSIGEKAKADLLELQSAQQEEKMALLAEKMEEEKVTAELEKEETTAPRSPQKMSKEWRRLLSKEVDANERSMAQEIMQRVVGSANEADDGGSEEGPMMPAVRCSPSKPAPVCSDVAKPWLEKKQKPNAPCACGSGKKFKKCCRVADRM